MLEQVKPTKQEELSELTKTVGQLFFDQGKLRYEIDLKNRQMADNDIKLHNLNQRALELQKSLEKEAQKEAMKINLSPAPEAPVDFR